MPLGYQKVLCRATWYSILAEIDLQWNDFKGWKKYQDNRLETKIKTIEQQQQLVWMHHAMRILEFRAPWKPMCYNRAVTAKRLLREKGIETTLHIGFEKGKFTNGFFEGHAWLTIQGVFITGLVPHIAIYNEVRPIK